MSVALPRILRTSSFHLTLLYAGLFAASVLILFGAISWATSIYMVNSLDAAVDSNIAELEDGRISQGTRAANAARPNVLFARGFEGEGGCR